MPESSTGLTQDEVRHMVREEMAQTAAAVVATADIEPPTEEGIFMGTDTSVPVLPVTIPATGNGYANGFHPSDAALIVSNADRSFDRGITSDVIREGQDNIKATLETRFELERGLQELKHDTNVHIANVEKRLLEEAKNQGDITRSMLRDRWCADKDAEIASLKNQLLVAGSGSGS